MPIIRAEHKDNFTQILNNLLNDERLTYGARGLMAHVLTHYDNWIFNGENYFVTNLDKISKVKKYLKELINLGYLKRYQEKNSKGTFSNVLYIFNEVPLYEKAIIENDLLSKGNEIVPIEPRLNLPITDLPIAVNNITDKTEEESHIYPKIDFPLSELPLSAQPLSENQILNNTNITNTKNKEEDRRDTLNSIIKAYTDNENLRDTIKDFIKMRKAVKKVMTNKALELMLKKLDSLTDKDSEKVEILNQSIFNSWQGIFPLKNSKNSLQQVKKNRPDKLLGWDD